MPNSPFQLIPDMLDWRQICGSGRPRKSINSDDIVLSPLPCEAEHYLVVKGLLAAVARGATHAVTGCHRHTAGLSCVMAWINTRGDSVLQTMTPHTITPSVGAVCHFKAKTEWRRSPWSLHTRTRLLSLLGSNLDLSLKTIWFHSAAVQFPRARHHSKRRRRWVGIKGSTRNECRDPKCLSARRPYVWFEKTHESLVKVLPVPKLRPMKQFDARVYFL
ncbi:uncharacterized protein TNCV_3856861 [Trichonephila clavipes]|nr:uncharacterized protein TNCV_3856861 [Trichonephila clavipes]